MTNDKAVFLAGWQVVYETSVDNVCIVGMTKVCMMRKKLRKRPMNCSLCSSSSQISINNTYDDSSSTATNLLKAKLNRKRNMLLYFQQQLLFIGMIMNLLLLHFAFNPNTSIQKRDFYKAYNWLFKQITTSLFHPFKYKMFDFLKRKCLFKDSICVLWGLFLIGHHHLENDLCVLDNLLGLVIYTYRPTHERNVNVRNRQSFTVAPIWTGIKCLEITTCLLGM